MSDTNVGPGMYYDTPEEKEIYKLTGQNAELLRQLDSLRAQATSDAEAINGLRAELENQIQHTSKILDTQIDMREAIEAAGVALEWHGDGYQNEGGLAKFIKLKIKALALLAPWRSGRKGDR